MRFIWFTRFIFIHRVYKGGKSMIKTTYPRLCGGTFYTLLLREKRKRKTKKQLFESGSDGLAQRFLLKQLIMLFDDTFYEGEGTSFETNTSLYAHCAKSYADNLPFVNNALISEFDRNMHMHYSSLCTKMEKILGDFLAIEKNAQMQQLVYSILNLIKEDESIAENEEFYVLKTGMPITKKELLNLTEVNLPALILGVWHYILIHREDNTIGKHTYEIWHEDAEIKGKARRFISNIGDAYDFNIKIETHYKCTPNYNESDVVLDDTITEEESSDIPFNENNNFALPMQSQFNFNFNGNGTNIGIAHNVVIKNGKAVSVD